MTFAVVTGASRGIGRAAALSLASRGVDVALLARDREALRSVAAEVARAGARATVIPCDVASPTEVERAVLDAASELGVPDIVVNNAGIVRRALIQDLTIEAWRETLDVNLTGTFLVTRAFLPSMLAAKRGRFVQIASISATLGTKGSSAYCASKWGVVGFTKSLAEELRGTGLCALCILPGAVDTAMLEGGGFAPQMTADEVARVITYAALDAPDAMNGSSLEVFGP